MNKAKQIKRQKDYKKKKNMLRNNMKQNIARGRCLAAGRGLIPNSKKYGKIKKVD